MMPILILKAIMVIKITSIIKCFESLKFKPPKKTSRHLSLK